jgi:HTH-type transcriptional regulator/antitoxin HigA
MAKNNKINNDEEYATVMAKIDALMAKGSGNVSKMKMDEIRELALMAQAYEKQKIITIS